MVHNSAFQKYCFYLIICCFSISVLAQENDDTTLQKDSRVISIDKISEASEEINQRIHAYKSILVPSGTIRELDSILALIKNEILAEKDTIEIELEDISRRDLINSSVEWGSYRADLKGYQDNLNKRIREVTKINDELISEINTWQETKIELKKNNNLTKVVISIDGIVETLNEVLQNATARLDSIYAIEKNLTELVLLTDDIIAHIKSVELEIKRDYFIFDSDPLWKSSRDSIPIQTDSAVEEKETTAMKFKSNQELVSNFFRDNAKTAAIQVVFVLLIFFLMIAVKSKWIIKLKDLSNPIEIQAKIVLKHYIAATVSVGVLISAFFYPALIPTVSEFFIFLILLGTLRLLPKLTNSRFLIFLACIFGIYIFNIVMSYMPPNSMGVRLLLIFECVILTGACLYARKLMLKFPADFVRIHKVFLTMMPLYVVLLVVSIVANSIGMLALAQFLFSGVFISVLLMMVLYLSVMVVTSLVVLVFKLRRKYGLQTVSTIVDATHKRFQPILFWAGMIVWFYFTLKGFEVLDFVMGWINDALLINWQIGKTSISLGGILSFTSIFAIALLVSKLASSIFQDQWMINILPRGIAPAISLILRIILIGIGFYIGLKASGINVGNLGFIIGALGVGIGFGLQNVVLNFIAGLILAFERPINLGDTIEVDNEFGVVTNIGVRSSNIRTYSGYEAIIPNGDLISKKVNNWTLTDRDRRSKILMRTAPNADPLEVIEHFNKIAAAHPKTFEDPAPKTYFMGYDIDGNLSFQLLYWSTFSDTLKLDHEIGLEIFSKLREKGIQAPAPVRRIFKT